MAKPRYINRTVPVRDGTIIKPGFDRSKWPAFGTEEFFKFPAAVKRLCAMGHTKNYIDTQIAHYQGVISGIPNGHFIRNLFGFVPALIQMPGCCAVHIVAPVTSLQSIIDGPERGPSSGGAVLGALLLEEFFQTQVFKRPHGHRGPGNLVLIALNAPEMRAGLAKFIVEWFGFQRLTNDFFNTTYMGTDSHIALFGALHSDIPCKGGNIYSEPPYFSGISKLPAADSAPAMMPATS